MLTLFIDISDIRYLFLNTKTKHTEQSKAFTDRDFRIWVMEAVNFLNLIYTDFGFGCDSKDRFSQPVTDFDGLRELYELVKDLLTDKELEDKTILSSYGFVYGDLLYFQVEVEKFEEGHE